MEQKPFDLIHDLLVVNKKAFFALNRSLSKIKLVIKMVTSTLLNHRFTPVNVSSEPLTGFPTLDHSIRQRAAHLSLTLDLAIGVSLFNYALICIAIVVVFYVNAVWPVYPLGTGLVILVEFTLIWYISWHGTKITLFFEHAISLLLYVFKKQEMSAMKKLGKRLMKVKKFKKEGQNKNKLAKSQRQLATFLQAKYLPLHLRILGDLARADSELVSSILLFSLLTFFGFNVYSVTSVVLVKTLSTSVYAVLLLFSFFVPFYIGVAI